MDKLSSNDEVLNCWEYTQFAMKEKIKVFAAGPPVCSKACTVLVVPLFLQSTSLASSCSVSTS